MGIKIADIVIVAYKSFSDILDYRPSSYIFIDCLYVSHCSDLFKVREADIRLIFCLMSFKTQNIIVSCFSLYRDNNLKIKSF